MAVVLSAPLGPDELEQLPLGDGERQAVEGDQVAVAAGQPLQFQHVVLLTLVLTRMSGLDWHLAAGPVGDVRPGRRLASSSGRTCRMGVGVPSWVSCPATPRPRSPRLDPVPAATACRRGPMGLHAANLPAVVAE